MQTIEQLRRDKRPLKQLGTVSAVTGEPLGNLLTRLATRDIPLFMELPEESRLYCVPQKGVEEYQEAILTGFKKHIPNGLIVNKKDVSPVEANHFRYLLLKRQDYKPLLDGDISLSVKLFSQSAFCLSDMKDLTLVSASEYLKEHFPNAHFQQFFKAKFACYFKEENENNAWPDTLKMKKVHVNTEKLLVSRTAMLELTEPEKKDESYPSELKEHLQPWKSEFLRSLNIVAYQLYSRLNRNEFSVSKINVYEIKESLKAQLSTRKEIEQKISQSATLLRHEYDQMKAKNYLKAKKIQHYPDYFSSKLAYLNEKSKKYHDDYSHDHKSTPHTAASIEKELTDENIIPSDTARRIAGEIKPDYENITRLEK